MYNILGTDEFSGKYKISDFGADSLYLKMYGKEESKPQRKLGHFNLVDSKDSLGVKGLLESLDTIKKQIKFIKV